MILLALLFGGILAVWVDQPWAWSAVQVGIFALAGWHVLRKREVRFDLPALTLAFACSWPVLQLLTGATMSRPATEEAAVNWFTFFVVFVMARGVDADTFATAAVIGGSAVALLSVLAKVSYGVLGPFANRNQFAAWVELLLPIALYLAFRWRAAYSVAAAILFAAVIASGSRAGAFLVCLEVVVVAVVCRRSRSAKLQFAAIALLAVGVAGWHDLRGHVESAGPEPLRADAVRASLEMLRDHPVAGVGLGAWSRIYPRYAGLDTGLVMNQAHNDWAQWAAEGGAPFLAYMIVFAALLWKPAIRSIYGMGVIAFLLHALVDYPMQQRPALSVWFFAVAGVVTAARNRFPRKDDLLRRTGDSAVGHGRRDPARLPAAGAARPS